MKLLSFLIAIKLCWILAIATTPAKRHYDTHDYYALEHVPDEYAGTSLEEVAEALGVEIVEQAGELQNIWLLRTPRLELEARHQAVDRVLSTFRKLQTIASTHLNARSEQGEFATKIVSSIKYLEPQIPKKLVKRAPPPSEATSAHGIARRLGLRDPLFPEQWHLVNDDYPEHMMNVTPVWDMGLTGKGVSTSFLDDGLDFESDDLKDAFDEENSYDFNLHVALPRPVEPEDSHGTRCAGQVAARRNDACGVGIAYDATAAGVRILGGPITTVDEAAALNYGYKKISIYSCSWGPPDNGRTMEGPNYLIRKAVLEGINNGRDGKGSIFVFASGNGGDAQDQCNFDGYTNSIYSVTVSSLDYKGLHPSYAESCAANMVVAYSSGSGNAIVTTDRGKNKCTHSHGGTSAAAPNAVGVFALALQARPELTWRDIQHLCVQTARLVNPEDNDWERTASGRFFSYKYGYGVLDAYAYVKAAQTWTLVKPQAWLHTPTIQMNGGRFYDSGHKNYSFEGGEEIGRHGIESKMLITQEMLAESNLEALEHIDVRIWIEHQRRGDVEIEIISPNGIKSRLASPRRYDRATTGFPGWRFMSVKHWGENPVGEWTISILDQRDPDYTGKLLGWNMVLWGSTIDPEKALKFIEPVVDNTLPPSATPPTVYVPDTTSTIRHSKPTEALPVASDLPSPDQDTEFEDWYGEKVASQKWYYAMVGAFVGLLVGTALYLWRRRAAQKKLAQYSSLAEDELPLNIVAQSHSIPRSARTAHDPSSSTSLASEHEIFIQPPTTRSLGFHSSFLDDDEASASAGLAPPEYRDEPDDRHR